MISVSIFKNDEVIKYVICGILTTVINYFVYYFLTISILNPTIAVELQLANIAAWVCAVIFAYISNRKWVFSSHDQNVLMEFIKFTGTRVLTLFLDMLLMFLFTSIFSIHDKYAKLISIVITTIINYLLGKIYVFKNKKTYIKNCIS
jgi:putative flippase GtrA